MKKTFTIIILILFLFLIPSFCNAYSLNDYEHINDFTFKDFSDFNLSVSSSMRNIINDETYNKIVFSTTLNNESYTILIGFPNSMPFILYDSGYSSAYTSNVNFLFGSTATYKASDIAKDYYGTSLGSVATSAKKNLTINDITYYYNGIVFNNSFGLFDVDNNIVYTNLTTFDFVYNNSVYNIDLTSTPEEPEEPTEIIDYNSKLDIIINILYLSIFIQFLFVIYYVIRSIFRYD